MKVDFQFVFCYTYITKNMILIEHRNNVIIAHGNRISKNEKT